MNMRLTIDIGNSSTKLGLWKDDDLEDTLTIDNPDAREIALFAGPKPAGAIACSVRKLAPDVLADIERLVGPVTLLTPSTPVPLKNAYASPDSLGMDRLAAAVGAAGHVPGRNLLVVDLGTAATYDFVDSNATFRGGNIAPGVKMRLDALHAYTSRLPLVEPKQPDASAPFGTTTRAAMVNGAVLGVAAEINYYHSLAGADAAVVLTGGDAMLVAPLLKNLPVAVVPHLVSYGLNRISLYNEA